MTMTVEMLEQRVAALEKEVAELKRLYAPPKPQGDMDYLERLAEHSPMIRAALDDQLTPEEIQKMREDLGIAHLEPITAEELQQRLIAEGYDPTSNEASRMLIEMRDEEG
jgi:Ca2+-binding EF-hand superfamily protein